MKLGPYAVHLNDDSGALRSFLPGQEVPDWAAKQLGPHCFATGPDAPPLDEAPPAEGDGPTGPPPRSGRGSGEGQWRQYAQDHGVDVTLVEGRDDIIAACEAAGVPVE